MSPSTNTAAKHSAAPERSLTQRLTALEHANEIRTTRAKLKKDLKAGRVSIHNLLAEPPPCMVTAKVFDMLLAVPKYGRVKVNKVLAQCRISPSKTVGGISERQRNELVRLLRCGPAATVPRTPAYSRLYHKGKVHMTTRILGDERAVACGQVLPAVATTRDLPSVTCANCLRVITAHGEPALSVAA